MKQVNNNKVDITSQLVDIAQQSLRVFENGDLNDIGYMLDTSWKLKQKQAQGITTEWIDTIYDEGIKAGALGGKLLGAGGGGYVMFYVPSVAGTLGKTMTGASLLQLISTDKEMVAVVTLRQSFSTIPRI